MILEIYIIHLVMNFIYDTKKSFTIKFVTIRLYIEITD
jgi:hypothetical protein